MKMKFTILAAAVLLLVSSISFGQCRETQSLKRQFQQFPAAKQAKVWRDHYRFALATETLTADQKDFITEALAQTKDEIYTAEGDKTGFAAFGSRAALLFPDKAQLKRIFYTLTAEEMQGFSLTQAAYRKAVLIEDCTCSISDNILCDTCNFEILSCTRTAWGCGFGWVLPCDAVCKNKPTRG